MEFVSRQVISHLPGVLTLCYGLFCTQEGYSGINVTGGGGGGGGPTEPNILHPKKYMDLILCIQKNK